MFCFKNKNKETKKQGKEQKNAQSSSMGTSDSQRLREQALANAKAAREALGQDTINRLARAIRQQEEAAAKQAQEQIITADAERVALEILGLLNKH